MKSEEGSSSCGLRLIDGKPSLKVEFVSGGWAMVLEGNPGMVHSRRYDNSLDAWCDAMVIRGEIHDADAWEPGDEWSPRVVDTSFMPGF